MDEEKYIIDIKHIGKKFIYHFDYDCFIKDSDLDCGYYWMSYDDSYLKSSENNIMAITGIEKSSVSIFSFIGYVKKTHS